MSHVFYDTEQQQHARTQPSTRFNRSNGGIIFTAWAKHLLGNGCGKPLKLVLVPADIEYPSTWSSAIWRLRERSVLRQAERPMDRLQLAHRPRLSRLCEQSQPNIAWVLGWGTVIATTRRVATRRLELKVPVLELQQLMFWPAARNFNTSILGSAVTNQSVPLGQLQAGYQSHVEVHLSNLREWTGTFSLNGLLRGADANARVTQVSRIRLCWSVSPLCVCQLH